MFYVAQLSEACNSDYFKKMIASDEYEFQFSCGVNKPITRIQFSEKEKISNAMCLHYSVLISLAELEQLRRGLDIQKFKESSHNAIRKAFVPPEIKVTSDFLQDLFVPVLSFPGSNKRVNEEALIMTWIRYLQSLEGV